MDEQQPDGLPPAEHGSGSDMEASGKGATTDSTDLDAEAEAEYQLKLAAAKSNDQRAASRHLDDRLDPLRAYAYRQYQESHGHPAGSTSARLAHDSPSIQDELGFAEYARAIARFLTHPDSKPPLTISIQAPWGGGKASLMLMIEKELDPAKKPITDSCEGEQLKVGDALKELWALLSKRNQPPYRFQDYVDDDNHRVTVWFNAWKYESTNQVWAGLVDAILQQVPARLEPKERERFWFRLNVSRVGGDRVRQRLHEYLFNVAFGTTLGMGRAILCAALAAVVTLIPWFFLSSPTLKWLFGLATPVSFSVVCAAMKILFAKWMVEAQPVGDVVKNLVDVPKYEQELGFVHHVERDLRRVFAMVPRDKGLVIFIDDLDRCSPLKVAAVLDAVNLFLATDFPKCCFVVGMDTEMVAAALQAAHKDLTANLPEDTAAPLGWRFMDKFVQLPFVLPPVSGPSNHRLMMRLLGRQEETDALQAPHTDGRSAYDEAQKLNEGVVDSEEFLELTKEAAAKTLSGNPRELKRFVNLLRFNYFLRNSRERQKLPVPPAATLGRWTAFSLRWPDHVRWLRRVRNKKTFDYQLAKALGRDRMKEALPDQAPNHFLALEALAQVCVISSQDGALTSLEYDIDRWANFLHDIYGLDKTKVAWIVDPQLFEFYVESGAQKSATDMSLGFHLGKGFW
ncbi:KAP family P-loop NTPase fold protein [Paraburkholderia aspalathi]|uniref:KAP family P-loop NTPase fold protein n=1 Tax=Paraburkholderia aspalathi TaxID=1324617 RepID=UPI0038B8D5BB